MPEITKPINVFFLTFHPFPFGQAQTNRLIAMAGGMIKAGCEVTVICLKPTEKSNAAKNSDINGYFNGIHYIYPSGTTIRHKNAFKRICHFLAGISGTTSILIKENRNNRIDFLFAGVLGFFIYLWFFIVCKFLRIGYLQERSEYPFIRSKKSVLDGLYLFLYLTIVCKLFDGFLVITHKLKEYFIPHLRKNCPVFLLPILVEPERFSIAPPPAAEKYIAYCGSMSGDKDGVPDLIDAFGIIAEKYPDINLYLIGTTEFDGFKELQQKIEILSLSTRIIFTGNIDRERLPDILMNAVMLVLARPDTKQAEGGFPTKLGEYLATGKPVVVTRVGEISSYLTDGENAFIAEPGNYRNFAAKMDTVLQDYNIAIQIGKRGQHLAQTTFNYMYQGKELVLWLKSVTNKIRKHG